MKQMITITSQFSEESGEPQTQPDTNRLYLDVVGVDTKKHRVYGLSSLASLSYPNLLHSSGKSHYDTTFDDTFEQRVQKRVRIEMQTIQQRLDEEQQKRNEEIHRRLEEEQQKRNEEVLDLKQKIADMERYF